MKNIVRSEPCPECRKSGRDKTGNHLMVFEDGNKFCGKKEHHKNGKAYTEILATNRFETLNHNYLHFNPLSIEEINKYPIVALPSRLIPKGVSNLYGVHCSYSEETGEIEAHYYPRYSLDSILSGYKIRTLPKEFSIAQDKQQPALLFGQCVPGFLNKRQLVITGGEEDALASYTITGRYLTTPIPAVSPPDGDNFKCFELPEVVTFLKSFKTIYLSCDKDVAGQKLEKMLVDLLGYEKVRIVNFSEHDVSDMLTKGKEHEYIDAINGAKEYKPSGIITVDDVWEEAIKMPEWGIPWPWPTLTKATYGIRRGEVYYFGAGVKIGKSEAEKQIIQHLLSMNLKVGAIFPEESAPMSYKKIAGKIAGKQFHIPDSGFTQEELIVALTEVKEKVYLYNRYASVEWEQIKEFIRYCVVSKGIKDIIIDPITCLTDGKESSEADRLLKQVTRELDYMTKDLWFSLYIFCHLNIPATGKPHEEGGSVKSAQFANSRAMMRVAQYCIGIERNKKAENPIERNTSTFVLLEDRNFGNFVKFPVYYSNETGNYLEPKGR